MRIEQYMSVYEIAFSIKGFGSNVSPLIYMKLKRKTTTERRIDYKNAWKQEGSEQKYKI
jgi:hypothetical protein